jgi:serine protease inhibitor
MLIVMKKKREGMKKIIKNVKKEMLRKKILKMRKGKVEVRLKRLRLELKGKIGEDMKEIGIRELLRKDEENIKGVERDRNIYV